jgi:hypothetical protein
MTPKTKAAYDQIVSIWKSHRDSLTEEEDVRLLAELESHFSEHLEARCDEMGLDKNDIIE